MLIRGSRVLVLGKVRSERVTRERCYRMVVELCKEGSLAVDFPCYLGGWLSLLLIVDSGYVIGISRISFRRGCRFEIQSSK